MRTITLAAAAMVVLCASASAETRNLSGFERVHASGQYDVRVEVGPEFAVSVEGSDAARIRTHVDDGTLKIEPRNRPWFGSPAYDVRVRITLPRLEGVAAARGATVNAVAGGECASFGAAAAMGANLRVTGLRCDAVDAAAAMGAILELAGTCDVIDGSAAMGGVIRADDLQCRQADISAAMGGDVAVYASASYDASAAMGGSVNVAGGGHAADRSTAMGGSVSETK